MRYVFILSYLVSLLLGGFIINQLRAMKVKQMILEIGPDWHMKKQGTPTMGGIIFLTGFLIGGIPVSFVWPHFWMVIFVTVGFGAVGFLDDLTKLKKAQNEGLTPMQKLAAQAIIVVIFGIYLYLTGLGSEMYIPFVKGPVAVHPVVFVLLLFFCALGTVNGVNLTDGIDGLAGSVTVVVTIVLCFMAMLTGQMDLGYGILCMTAGIMGFLYYNINPAKVFMGDSGSLALGGFIVCVAYMLQAPVFILLFGIIYLIETLSVILQVTYFKLTHGKRLFKMSPIHHHFEKSGWSENRIVFVFSSVALFFGILAIFLYRDGVGL